MAKHCRIKVFLVINFILILFPISLSAQTTFETTADAYGDKKFAGKYINGIFSSEGQRSKKSVLIDSLGDTLYSFPTPGTWPGGLAWDGNYFWNSDADSQRIYKLTTTGIVDTSFPMPSGTTGGGDLEWDGSYLWLVDEQTAKLYKLDPATGLPLQSFNLPDSASSDPNSWGLTWDGNYLWHSQYQTQAKIFKIDPSNGRVLFSFTPPRQSILGIAWAGNYLYGVDIDGMTIYKMNPSNGSVVDSTRWQIPYPLGLKYDGSYFWNVSSAIPYGNQRIYKVDAGIGMEEHQTLNDERFTPEIYPNPAKAVIRVRIPWASFTPNASCPTLKIFDASGKLIKEIATSVSQTRNDGDLKISLSGINPGIYFLQFGKTIKKFLVVR